MAGQFGSTFALVFSGKRSSDGEPFVFLQVAGGGWGAKKSSDGASAMTSLTNGHFNDCPVEVLEAKYPLLVERYSLREDSAGDGRTRGGLGIRQDFRVLQNGVTLSTTCDLYRIQPAPLEGGLPAQSNRVVITTGGQEQVHALLSGLPLSAGAVVSQQSGGGGGFGPAMERKRAAIESDVREGYISREKAKAVYAWQEIESASKC